MESLTGQRRSLYNTITMQEMGDYILLGRKLEVSASANLGCELCLLLPSLFLLFFNSDLSLCIPSPHSYLFLQ